MNIFWIEFPSDLASMARSLCDQHYSRMIYETCVLLCNAYYSTGESQTISGIYQKHYYNHPQCKYARENLAHFNLILKYLQELIISYAQHGGTSWGRERILFKQFAENPPSLPTGQISPPYLTFGNKSNPELDKKYKAIQAQYGVWDESKEVWTSSSWSVGVQAYRTYYNMKIFRGGKLPKWTKNQKPDWYNHTDICLNSKVT